MRHIGLGRVCAGLGAAATLTAMAALGACSSSPPTPVVSTSSGTSSTSATSSSTSSRSTTTTSRPTTSSGTSTTSGGSVTACKAGTGKATVVPSSGGASAGHVQLEVQVTNTSSAPCTVRGYPGVSLVAGTEGAPLGAAGQRSPGPEGLVTLKLGAKATAHVQLAEASNYPNCGVAAAAGFRVYLPDDTAAQFSPLAQQGCSNTSVVLLEVSPFTTS